MRRPLADRRRAREGSAAPVVSPIDGKTVGQVSEATRRSRRTRSPRAARGFPPGRRGRSPNARPRSIGRPISTNAIATPLLALLQHEGGEDPGRRARRVCARRSTFCRYYGAQARAALAPERMPGPTGETNELHHRGRGGVRLYQPVEFSARDLSRGRSSPRWSREIRFWPSPPSRRRWSRPSRSRLMHQAGITPSALQLLLGDGKVGGALVADARVAGVAIHGLDRGRADHQPDACGQGRSDRAADRRDRPASMR
jgi:RHH-type proline utilization regulon transcriptional repressor/proline dehydrogenase/delta 1-pyrroline-5-carboxylate dehydrogenase